MKLLIQSMAFAALTVTFIGQLAQAHGGSPSQRPQSEPCTSERLPNGSLMQYQSCYVADTGAKANAMAKFGGACICNRHAKVSQVKVRFSKKGTDNELSSEQFDCMTGEHAEAGEYVAMVVYTCR